MNDSTQVELLYGRGRLRVELPESVDVEVIRKRPLPKLTDPRHAVEDSLDHPDDCPGLAELARGRRDACIVVCDITRPVPNHLFLRPMLERMTASGIPLASITILIANGMHRAGDDAEIAEIIGDPWVVENVRIVSHDACDRASLTDLGRTAASDCPVWVNRLLVDADLRIVTGLVEPHFMAGWSGGRKVVAPGVAGEDTIRTFHSSRFMEDPRAVQCNLEGNPLHLAQREIVHRIGELYALNTVIDEDRDLSFVNFGRIEESHLRAVDFVQAYAVVDSPRRFHTIVTSSAGYPLDRTYYQTIKGMVTPMDILEPGGTIIMVSECSEGLGSAHFRDAQRRLVALGMDAFAESLSHKELADIDEWQTEMQLKPMRVGTIRLYATGLDAEDLLLTGVEPTTSVEAAVLRSIAEHPGAVAVIPEGPYVIPMYRPVG